MIFCENEAFFNYGTLNATTLIWLPTGRLVFLGCYDVVVESLLRRADSALNHGHLHTGTAKSSFFFLTSDQPEGQYLETKLHPGGGFFGPWFFIILKNSHQDLSNEGSNFILSQLEVGHWVAQTWPFLKNYLNYKLWPLATISEQNKILNLLSFDLGHW